MMAVMEDWRTALAAAPAPPPGLLEFAADQASVRELWNNSLSGDWLVWLAANGFAGTPSAERVVRGAVILGDYCREPIWRQMLRARPAPLHVLRGVLGDENLDQFVAHVYWALAIASVPSLVCYYSLLASRSTFAREAAMGAVFWSLAIVVTAIFQLAYRRAVRRAATGLTTEAAVPIALDVARAASRRNPRRAAEAARFMRKLFDPPTG